MRQWSLAHTRKRNNTGHGDEPIGLSSIDPSVDGWPSSDTGPSASYQNGWQPQQNDRYVANQTGFSNTDRHTYNLVVRALLLSSFSSVCVWL